MSAISPKYTNVSGDMSPLPDHVLVVEMEKGDKLSKGGIIVLDDNGSDRGIRPRWCKVYKVGSKIDYLQEGEWILVAHGRWTWPVNCTTADGTTHQIQRVDTKDILGVSKKNPL